MSSKLGMVFSIGVLLMAVTMDVVRAQPRRQSREPDPKAQAIFKDAAEYQNNQAFEIAVEEWKKLLAQFPDDPLASQAQHYLGVSCIQIQDYDQAIAAFTAALQDSKLKLREESLINLSWCLFTRARAEEPNSASQNRDFQQAKSRLSQFLKEYSDGEFVDQALFYSGEIEYTQGNARESLGYYRRLLESPEHQSSILRPDARYALAIAYEELKDLGQSSRNYLTFLEEHGSHRLAKEVKVRLADFYLLQGQAAKAEQLLTALDGPQKDELADYVLLRLGYALGSQGKNDEAAQKYLQLLKQYPDSKHAATAAVSLGQTLFQSGNYDEAIERFRLALPARDEQAAEAAHWMAITWLRQNKPQEAIALLEDAVRWAKDNVTLKMDYADALYAVPQQLEKARSVYELIAEQHEADRLAPRAAYNAAFAALQMRDFAKARTWSEWFLQRFPQDPLRSDVAYVAAEALLQEGEHETAIQAYSKLRNVDSQNPSFDLWTLRLAMAQYLAGQYPAAIRLLNESAGRFEDARQKAEAEFILGASLLYEEKIDEAIEQLLASHRTSQEWGSADEVLLLLSEAQQRIPDNQAAKETLEMLLRKYPATRLRGQVEYKLGQLSATLDQLDEAIRRYQSIVEDSEAASFHTFARYGIAWCLMQQDQYAPALEQLQTLLRQNSGGSVSAEARLAEGVCLRKLGRVDEAVTSLEQFLSSNPKGVSLGNGLYELGLAYNDQRQLQKANEQFRRLLNDAPSYPALDKVLYELAWNYEEAGDPQAATQYFERLASEHPKSEFAAEATYMIAQRHYEAKDYGRAVATYSRVLKNANDAELREKALYKLGWSLFQQQQYAQAAQHFVTQADEYKDGPLFVDALFMQGECLFKEQKFPAALEAYTAARSQLEATDPNTVASEQVRTLIYLHGAQCLREMQDWQRCENWLKIAKSQFPESPYIATVLYELGYCTQKQNRIVDALKLFGAVANDYRNEVGARARFMMGEIYFAQSDFAKAIPEFQRVMYGFGSERAPDEIKNWQAKSAFEAARCSEVLIENLSGPGREKAIETAQEFYRYIVEKHATHDLVAQAQTRLGELRQLR